MAAYAFLPEICPQITYDNTCKHGCLLASKEGAFDMNKVNNHIDYVEFPAKSVEELGKVKDFLSAVFGWSYTMYGDDYADTADSGTSSGINAEDPTPTPLVVIYAADLQATYDMVNTAGGTITKEIFDFPCGKRFHFQDPAGNHLAVWSE